MTERLFFNQYFLEDKRISDTTKAGMRGRDLEVFEFVLIRSIKNYVIAFSLAEHVLE